MATKQALKTIISMSFSLVAQYCWICEAWFAFGLPFRFFVGVQPRQEFTLSGFNLGRSITVFDDVNPKIYYILYKDDVICTLLSFDTEWKLMWATDELGSHAKISTSVMFPFFTYSSSCIGCLLFWPFSQQVLPPPQLEPRGTNLRALNPAETLIVNRNY